MQGESVKTVRLKTRNHEAPSNHEMPTNSDHGQHETASNQEIPSKTDHEIPSKSGHEKSQKQLKEEVKTHNNMKFLLVAVSGALVSMAILFR